MAPRVVLTGMCLLVPTAAAAHVVANSYVLPVPFWMYMYGCAAMLVVSFGVLGYFWSAESYRVDVKTREITSKPLLGAIGRFVLSALRVGAVVALALTIATGLLGTSDPTRNPNLSLFWIAFLLGFTYTTVLFGDLYSLVNPWQTIAQWVLGDDRAANPPRRYPDAASYWPAFLLYLALIWIELFVLPIPYNLSVILVVYSIITWTGAYLFGANTWFQKGDVFGVFFRLVSTLAPVEYMRSAGGRSLRVRIRAPFVGALESPPESAVSLILFVLLMLASTTYDALHQTVLWAGWFWRPALSLSQPLFGDDLGKAQRLLENWFVLYQRLGLVLSPFIYLALYLLCLAWARLVTGVKLTLRELARNFAFTLIPIAVAYNFTHYAPTLIVEASQIWRRLSDPFGWGWNLLNVAPPTPSDPLISMGVVWHAQVALILIGHVASVYLAHVVALRTFPTRRQVMVSQLPLLCLMVALTVIGLWILALPLAGY